MKGKVLDDARRPDPRDTLGNPAPAEADAGHSGSAKARERLLPVDGLLRRLDRLSDVRQPA